MNQFRRPVDLPLLKIRLPIGGLLSITHRITGVLLVAILPIATYCLQRSLADQQGFNAMKSLLNTLPVKIIALVFIAIFVQHLISGIRHLLLDMHIGIEKSPARISAWLSYAISIVIIVLIALRIFL